MKFLHTADWHIGRMLHSKKRYPEFTAFLDWLVLQLDHHSIDTLLVPGDIFDTRSPSNRAQELYYSFLVKASQTCCQHIVITSGNHDSPTFLDAPKSVLRALNVHIVGQAGNPADELISLKDKHGNTEALIAAVPYLRDRDLRKAEAGESIEDKELKIIEGIKLRYQTMADLAEKSLSSLPAPVPTIAMGHLFALGGKTGDGVRELYVGNLGSIGADAFPDTFQYVALGHLHVPQTVGNCDHIRYSGSPIPMGYGEAGQQKQLLTVDFHSPDPLTPPTIAAIPIPTFQQLVRLSGNLDELLEQIASLSAANSSAWLEINYTGTNAPRDLRSSIYRAIEDSTLEIRLIKKDTSNNAVSLSNENPDEALEDLTETDVFTRCLNHHNIPDADRPALLDTYQQILTDFHENDSRAE